jgi:mannose-6-phosphate isomerase-like protein (cupin superfamily)
VRFPVPLLASPLLASRLFGLAALCVASVLPVAACRSPQRPPPPRLDPNATGRAPTEIELQPYLDQYPLTGEGTRMDLLAISPERSMHLVQTTRVIASHRHPDRTEITYVLTGRGTVYVEDRMYPAVAGSAFRIAPGTLHSVHPEPGETLRAVVYYEPPLHE